MRLAHWLWISGFLVAPVGGWFTAKLSNVDRPQAYVTQKPVEASALLIAGQTPAASPSAAESPPPAATPAIPAVQASETDELARAKADLSKLLTTMRASNVDAAVENYSKLEAQVIEQASSRDNAITALAEVGAKNVGDAIGQIRDLKQRITEVSKTSAPSQGATTQEEACQNAQGWQCQYSPACPAPTVVQMPVTVAPETCAYDVVY